MSNEPKLPRNYVPVKDDAKEAKARHERIDVYKDVGRVSLVPGGVLSNSKRGKSAGFYCEVCNLTFKDSIQYTDHLNSKQHLHTSGLKENSSRATLQDVKDRLEMLKHKKEKERSKEEYSIKSRIEARKKLDEQIKEQQRERRQRRRRKNHGGEEQGQEQDMAAVMGISGFGSTKR